MFFILRRIEQDFTTNVYMSSCKVPVIIVRIYLTLRRLMSYIHKSYFTDFLKIASSICVLNLLLKEENSFIQKRILISKAVIIKLRRADQPGWLAQLT